MAAVRDDFERHGPAVSGQKEAVIDMFVIPCSTLPTAKSTTRPPRIRTHRVSLSLRLLSPWHNHHTVITHVRWPPLKILALG